MNLDFGAHHIFDTLYTKRPGKLERFKYVRWVNSVLKKHRGTKVEQFRVCFYLEFEPEYDIDFWIIFAVKKGVRELLLDSLTFCDPRYISPLCTFPPTILSFKDIGFESLQVLVFKCVNVCGQVLERFLTDCPVLEQLIVWYSDDLFNVRVAGGPSLALKHLEIKECTNLEHIEVSAPNLVSFNIDGYKLVSFILGNVPKLVEVSISWLLDENFRTDIFNLLSCCLSQLEILKIDISSAEEYTDDQVFPVFRNLKHLQFHFNLYGSGLLPQLSSFMTAFPYLQRLVLVVAPVWNSGILIEAVNFRHDYLKVVEILGYQGRERVVEFVMHIVENAVSLQKIVIDPRKYRSYPSAWPYPSTWYVEEMEIEDKARSHAMVVLKPKLPSTIEFVCL